MEQYSSDFDDELFYLRADVYSYGQLVAYALTGTMPWQGRNSVSVKGIENNLLKKEDKVDVPEDLKGKLKNVMNDCRLDEPEKRPTADQLVLDDRYFAGNSCLFLFTCLLQRYTLDKGSVGNVLAHYV